MLNVGFGELLMVVIVVLVVFGPERLPDVARQIGRFIGRVRLTTQRMLDELKNEAELRDLNLPDLQVGSLRSQARAYVQDLMDVEGQMAELERERQELKAALDAEHNGDGPKQAAGDGATDASATGLGPPPVDPEAT